MNSNLLRAKVNKPHRIFNRDELYDIHLATMSVLEDTGVQFLDTTVLDFLERYGATVDKKRRIARFRQYLVEDLIKKAPRTVTLHARNPKYDLRLEPGTVYPQVGGECPLVFDLQTNEVRKATLRDLNDLVRLVDGLDFYTNCCLVNPTDVPPSSLSPHCTESLLNNTEKHCFYGITAESGYEGFLDSIGMVAKVVGGTDELRKRHIASSAAFATSPLQYTPRSTMAIRQSAEHNIPINVGTNPMAGATSPISLVGTLIQQNAEILAGVILAQLYNPGNPVIYDGFAGIMDMKSATLSMGSPEQALLSAGTAQIASRYGLPSVFQACIGDSKTWDPQMGYEKVLSAYMTALAGGNLPMGSGHHDNALIMCYKTLVLDNEIWNVVLRAIRGINTDDEAFAINVIHDVGPGGNYLAHQHTSRNLRREQYIPQLTDRTTRDTWKRKGAKSILDRAREKALDILASHHPEPLEKDIQENLRQTVARAERRLEMHA